MTTERFDHILWRILRDWPGNPPTTADLTTWGARFGFRYVASHLAGMCCAGYAVPHDRQGHVRTWTAGVEPGTRPRKKHVRREQRILVTTDTLTRALADDLEAVEELRRALEREET